MANLANNERIARNAIFLYIRMFFILIINLFIARLLLSTLGVEDYGVYNVVAGFVALFGFLNMTLSSSVQRFYNYEGTLNGAIGFRNIYTTAIFTHAILAITALVLLETFGIWYVNNIMVLPTNRLLAANLLFQTSALSMLLMMMQIPYSGAVMARERMDFYAVVSIIDTILKLLAVIIITKINYDNLIAYGVLLLSVSICTLMMYIVFCRNRFPEMRLQRHFDKNVFKSMMTFSSWNLVGTFAWVLKGQGINLLLNFFFGPVVNAARAVALQVNGAISNLAGNVGTAFGPQMVTSYAERNYTRTKKIFYLQTKACFSLMALLIAPAIFEMPYLLHLWLGDNVPIHTITFTIITLIDSLIWTLNPSCTQIIQATGKIKNYQIGATIVNFTFIPFCWILLYGGLSAETIFYAMIPFTCINQIVCLYFVKREFKFNLASYFKQIIIRCLLLIILIPIVPFLIYYLFEPSFIRVIVMGITSVAYSIGVIYLCMFDRQEKQFIRSIIENRFGKIRR